MSINQQELFNKFTDFMNANGISPSRPEECLMVLGALMGCCAKVIDEKHHTDDALHTMHDVSKQAYDQAVIKG